MFEQTDIFVIFTGKNCTHVIFYRSNDELIELYCSDDMGLEIDEVSELSEV